MKKPIAHVLLVALLIGELISGGCASIRTIEKPEFRPLAYGEPLSPEKLESVKKKSPKDAVFADLLQAFALMRTSTIEQKSTQNEILNLLTASVSSFEDMTDPVNFSKAFSQDEDKAFRGRPHERMFASLMAGVFYMAQDRYEMALPYLRNAEFLDARFQKMPFGTDAPLVYALMYRCQKMSLNDPQGLKHASDGLFRSVRFLTLQTPLINALVAMASSDMREMAISRRLAYMLYEISIYYTLMTAPNDLSVNALIDDAAKNAELFTATLDSHFESEYKKNIAPTISTLAPIYGLKGADGQKHLKDLALGHLPLEVKSLAAAMKRVMTEVPSSQEEINRAMVKTRVLSQEILKAAEAEKVAINFSGTGPVLQREGSYDEIAVEVPGPDASPGPSIRERSIKTATGCGFHRTKDGGFSLVLCKNSEPSRDHRVVNLLSAELLSLSRKATSVGGRQFDKVLKGRAQFRAATEDIATISAWSAFFLFHMGASIISDCQRRRQGEACYASGYALWGIAGVTAIFSGTVWLFGRATNPSADSRFIHLMYESAWLGIRGL